MQLYAAAGSPISNLVSKPPLPMHRRPETFSILAWCSTFITPPIWPARADGSIK